MTSDSALKLSVAGKGGSGKTTTAAGLALALARRGQPVFAVDGDSNNCLGYALGFPTDELARLRPLAEMREELEQRAQPAGPGTYLLAPPVADLIDQYSLARDHLRLLVMGTIGEAGGGCACGLNAALREVLRQMTKRPEAVIVDMEAGVEHLGRGTAAAMDSMLIVTEPAESSLRTCLRVAQLATDLGIRRIAVIANKVRDEPSLDIIRAGVGALPVVAALPYLPDLSEPLDQPIPDNQRALDILANALDQLSAL